MGFITGGYTQSGRKYQDLCGHEVRQSNDRERTYVSAHSYNRGGFFTEEVLLDLNGSTVFRRVYLK